MGLFSSAPTQQQDAITRAAARWTPISLYFASLYLFSFVAPTLMRTLISARGWDRNDNPLAAIFRFDQAPWYYLLTGADFDPAHKPDFISVSAVVDVAGQPVLYTGMLDGFFFNTEGQLDRLVLEQVSRRPLSSDKRTERDDERFYPIDGDYFVLKYADVLSLNVQYVQLLQGDSLALDAQAA